MVFSDIPGIQRRTRKDFELALPVIFESGWVHFIDAPGTYLHLPSEIKSFLGSVPAAWDETKFIDGYPGKFIVLARRSGKDWYLGGINGEASPREVAVELTFLGEGEYDQLLCTDGETGREISTGREPVDASTVLRVPMTGFGGFAAMISPQ